MNITPNAACTPYEAQEMFDTHPLNILQPSISGEEFSLEELQLLRSLVAKQRVYKIGCIKNAQSLTDEAANRLGYEVLLYNNILRKLNPDRQ